MISRYISALTAGAWLYLLYACVGAMYQGPNHIAGPNELRDFMVGIALIVVVCCVVGAAVYSALRVTRALPVILFISSLAPAYLFALGLWRLQDPTGARFFQILARGDYGWFQLLQDMIFIGLPLCWAAVCLAQFRRHTSKR